VGERGDVRQRKKKRGLLRKREREKRHFQWRITRPRIRTIMYRC
jgi:hypothetical protein